LTHTSHECNTKSKNHKDNATFKDIMGGSKIRFKDPQVKAILKQQ